MDLDYTAMVNDFVRPAVSFFLFAFMILGWAVAYQLMKEVTELKIKLGRETQQEKLKEWMIRESANLVFKLYALRNVVVDFQLQSKLKQLLTKKRRIWRLIFQID